MQITALFEDVRTGSGTSTLCIASTSEAEVMAVTKNNDGYK